MKLFRHITLLLLSVLVAGCYDYGRYEVEKGVGTQRDITQCFDAQGKAWLTLSLDLSQPSEPTRTTRGTFGDGDGAEYAIKTLTLVLFHGPQTASEDALTVASTCTLDYDALWHSDVQVTQQSGATFQLSNDNLNVGDRLCLLAIANMTPDISTGQTFNTVRNLQMSSLTTDIDGSDYFVMTNSPVATACDGSGAVRTLVEVSADNLFATAEESLEHPAADVYMERAAARLTVTQSVTPMVIQGNTAINFTADDMRFGLYKYNKKCYLVRHFDSVWLSYNAGDRGFRFTETSALPSGDYRTYWAMDANYDGTGDKLSTIQGWKMMGESYYLAENTFDVGHMTDENTTAAVVYLRLNGGNDFYTTSVTGSDVIYQLPANDAEEDGTSASETFARKRSAKVASAKTIDEYLREWLWQTNRDFRQWVNDYAGGDMRHVRISVETNESSGLTNAQVTAVTQTARTSGSGVTAFNGLDLVNYLNDNITLRYYHEGRCFYHVPIRHFDDTQAPWQSPSAATSNSAAQAYGGNANDYLGRYGVVRNNWYNLNITGVAHVGSPVAPDATSTTDADDCVEQLLGATLTISGWSSHDNELKP